MAASKKKVVESKKAKRSPGTIMRKVPRPAEDRADASLVELRERIDYLKSENEKLKAHIADYNEKTMALRMRSAKKSAFIVDLIDEMQCPASALAHQLCK